MKKPMFMVVEGMDFSGKSSFCDAMKEHLTKQGREVVVLQNPGGDDEMGAAIRKLIKSDAPRSRDVDMMLFAANRVHLAHRIQELLGKGIDVIVDRWDVSAHVYQSTPEVGILKDRFYYYDLPLQSKAMGWAQPDYLIYLDIDNDTAYKRSHNRGVIEGETDRYEYGEDSDFDTWYETHKEAYDGVVSVICGSHRWATVKDLFHNTEDVLHYKVPEHLVSRDVPYKECIRYPVAEGTTTTDTVRGVLEVIQQNNPVEVDLKLTEEELAGIMKAVEDKEKEDEKKDNSKEGSVTL